MEIFGNDKINQGINIYNKSTRNNIGVLKENGQNAIFETNIFSERKKELQRSEVSNPIKKKRKSKRLNIADSEYLPDESREVENVAEEENFFLEPEKRRKKSGFKKVTEYILTNVFPINYIYLKKKEKGMKHTVSELSDINENVNELLATRAAYGEEDNVYKAMETNLINAVNIMSRNKKEFNKN